MKKFLTILIIIFTTIGFFSFIFILFNKAYFNNTFIINTELAANFGDFFGGYVGTLFSILSALLIVYTIVIQNIETRKGEIKNHFFKMVDYHIENVKQISISHISINKKDDDESEGRRAFVIFKYQIKELLDIVKIINSEQNLNLTTLQIIDIAYMVFYYGIDEKWRSFIEEKFSIYGTHKKAIIDELLKKITANTKLKLGRTNQTSISAYFRNMYTAIKLVDNNSFLTKREKIDLINIYRAQLSNPELYVLFFNITSRFGEKWKKNNYILKYKFIKNIPKGYCGDGFEPKVFFDIIYEHEEY